MKKIIALLLCGTTSCTFGLNWNVAKPNTGTAYSWTGLSSTQRYIMFVASALSLIGITYCVWPTSEDVAHRKAQDAFIDMQKKAAQKINGREWLKTEDIKKPLEDIKNDLKKGNLVFSFGSIWKRGTQEISVDSVDFETDILGIKSRTLTIKLTLTTKKPSQPDESCSKVYDSIKQLWIDVPTKTK